jgi:hypothetical protein
MAPGLGNTIRRKSSYGQEEDPAVFIPLRGLCSLCLTASPLAHASVRRGRSTREWARSCPQDTPVQPLGRDDFSRASPEGIANYMPYLAEHDVIGLAERPLDLGAGGEG